MIFSFCRLVISALLFWVVFNHFEICKICCSSKYHRSYIDENIIITKLQKLYSPVRNLRVDNKSPMLLLKKSLCKGDLSPAIKAVQFHFLLVLRHVFGLFRKVRL